MVGRFCRLEPLDASRHASALAEANAADVAGALWTYLPYGPFADFEAYAAWVAASAVSVDPMFYVIVPLAAGRAAGVSSYLRIDRANGSIEVGHLAYAPCLQRTPAATEAMFLMMERAFGLGYRRYEWKCNALNRPSRVAAQRLGFSYEGTFRQAAVVKGRSRDTAWFSVIDREWPSLREAFRQWLEPSNFDARGVQRVSLADLTRGLLKTRDPELEG
jgi:RimJ/RimL family protein N-acetyltransferase